MKNFVLAALLIFCAAISGQQTVPPFNTAYGNFTTGIQLNGSYGTPGLCPVSTGTGTAWSACAGAGSAAAHYFLGGPTSGAPAVATYRPLIAGDIPDLSSIYCLIAGCTMSGQLILPEITLNTNTSFWNSQAPGMLQNADNGCWEAWAIDTAGNPPYRDLAVAECLQLSTTTPASETDTLYIRSHKPTALIAANSGNVARCGHDACIGDTTLHLDRVMALGVPNAVANSGYILVGTFTNGDREQLGYPFATASGNNGATLTGVTALTYNHNAGELVTSLNDTADNTSFGYNYDNTAGDANMTSGVIYGANSAPLWAVGTPYTQGNIVYWPASLPNDVYVALQSTTGNTPTTSPTYWQYLGPATEPDMTGLSIRGAGNSQSFSGDILNDLYGGTEMLRIDSNGQITARSNATSRTLSSITITSGAKTLVSSNSNVTTLAAAVTANAHWISLAAPITLDSNNVVTIDTSTSQEQCLVRYGNGTASMYLSRCMFVHGNITSNNATILAHSAGATITASDFTYNDLEQARYVTGSGIPAATYITAVADGLHATMSQNATANSSISLTIYAASLDLLTTASVPLVFFTGYNGGSGAITDVCTAFGAAANIACTYTLEADTSGSINASVAAQSSQGSVVLEENGSSANATLQTNNTSPILIGTNCTIGSTSCVGLKVDGSNNVVIPNMATSPATAPICPNGTGGALTITGCVVPIVGGGSDSTVPKWLQNYSNGISGAVSCSGNTSGDVWATTWTVPFGSTCTVNGPAGLVIHASTSITIAGTLNARGLDISSGIAGCGGASGAGSGGGAGAGTAGASTFLTTAAAGLAAATGGAAGTAGTAGSAGATPSSSPQRAVIDGGCGSGGYGMAGGFGQAGGSSGGARGLEGSGVTLITPSFSGTDGSHTGTIDVSGQYGLPAAANSTGSGSGGGAGVVIIASQAAIGTMPTLIAAPGAGAGAGTTTSIVPEAIGYGGVGVTVEPVMTLAVSGGAISGTCTVVTAGTSTATGSSAPVGWNYAVVGGGGTLGTGTVNVTWSSGSVASCTITSGSSSGYTAATYTSAGTGATGGYGWWAECQGGLGCTITNQ